ncbi:MAG: Franean1_4349 family RiPP [Chloroflexi bacterium]|nr:Franean1_4349 family RiPP [Chloroflexota bacterium]
MSAETVTTIIRRAVAEQEFRAALFADPATALSGYELTEEERAALTGLTAENFDALAGDLEARVSKVTGAGLAIGFYS